MLDLVNTVVLYGDMNAYSSYNLSSMHANSAFTANVASGFVKHPSVILYDEYVNYNNVDMYDVPVDAGAMYMSATVPSTIIRHHTGQLNLYTESNSIMSLSTVNATATTWGREYSGWFADYSIVGTVTQKSYNKTRVDPEKQVLIPVVLTDHSIGTTTYEFIHTHTFGEASQYHAYCHITAGSMTAYKEFAGTCLCEELSRVSWFPFPYFMSCLNGKLLYLKNDPTKLVNYTYVAQTWDCAGVNSLIDQCDIVNFVRNLDATYPIEYCELSLTDFDMSKDYSYSQYISSFNGLTEMIRHQSPTITADGKHTMLCKYDTSKADFAHHYFSTSSVNSIQYGLYNTVTQSYETLNLTKKLANELTLWVRVPAETSSTHMMQIQQMITSLSQFYTTQAGTRNSRTSISHVTDVQNWSTTSVYTKLPSHNAYVLQNNGGGFASPYTVGCILRRKLYSLPRTDAYIENALTPTYYEDGYEFSTVDDYTFGFTNSVPHRYTNDPYVYNVNKMYIDEDDIGSKSHIEQMTTYDYYPNIEVRVQFGPSKEIPSTAAYNVYDFDQINLQTPGLIDKNGTRTNSANANNISILSNMIFNNGCKEYNTVADYYINGYAGAYISKIYVPNPCEMVEHANITQASNYLPMMAPPSQASASTAVYDGSYATRTVAFAVKFNK